MKLKYFLLILVLFVSTVSAEVPPDLNPASCISIVGTTWINISCTATPDINETTGLNVSNTINSTWNNVTGLDANVTGLTPNTQYIFSIYAYNSTGDGNLSVAPVPHINTTLALDSYPPPALASCTAIAGSTWINVSCVLGSDGNVTNGTNITNTITGEWGNSTETYWNQTGLTSGSNYSFRAYSYNASGTPSLNATYVTVSNQTILGGWAYPNQTTCDLQLSNSTATLNSCSNSTYYNFTMTGAGDNITFGVSTEALAYDLRYPNGTVVQTINSNYFAVSLIYGKTYYITKISSGWNETYIVSTVGVIVVLGYGLWNRRRR